MRVSRAQAQENRRTIIDVASRLFRARGFDGIGLNDLMKGAGLTQGGFDKQFQSKVDLVVHASTNALESGAAKWAEVVAKARKPLRALVSFYLSERHCHETAEGCALSALGSDAARRSPALRQTFEAGIKSHLDILDGIVAPATGENVRDRSTITLSTMVGALVLSRAVNDKRLSESFLQAAANGVLLEQSPRADHDRS